MLKCHTAITRLLTDEVPKEMEKDIDGSPPPSSGCLAAMQVYAKFDSRQLADVERLVERCASGRASDTRPHTRGPTAHPAPAPRLQVQGRDLCVAYIDDVEGKKKTNLPTEAAPEKTFYSCLIDGTQRDGNGRLKKDAEGRLAPTYIIELPGVPILGNGKSDNQNCALPFTRGPILQAIDCNQEGYLEEAFKLPCALREFEFTNRAADTPKPPAIVGFREHIFSGIGLLGDLAASSELCFGTLVQRTMADPLWCRYHYGHPDMLDKLALLAQGGVSKATKEAQPERGRLRRDGRHAARADDRPPRVLPGGTLGSRPKFTTHHSPPLHRHRSPLTTHHPGGEGARPRRDHDPPILLEAEQGTAQMTTSRQALRLGLRLGLTRLLGFYYAHIGYYLGQLHYYHASYAQLALMLAGAICDGTGVLPAPPPRGRPLQRPLRRRSPFSSSPSRSCRSRSRSSCTTARGRRSSSRWRSSRASRPSSSSCSRARSPTTSSMDARPPRDWVTPSVGASYIPTGRGLAISHQKFSELYASFAASSIYPGIELLLLLVLPSSSARASRSRTGRSPSPG